MSRPIDFGVPSVRLTLNVTPAAWVEAAARRATAAPLRIDQRPFGAKDAARAFAALLGATPHRIIAEGDEIVVEVPIHIADLPPAIIAEWARLRAVAETGDPQATAPNGAPTAAESEKTVDAQET